MIHVEAINNVLFQSRTYLMWKEEAPDAYLVDCGDMAPIQYFLSTRGKFLKGIFLTHCHYDHIYGLRHLTDDLSQVTIYASPETEEGLRDARINLSRYQGEPFELDGKAKVTLIGSRSEINLFDAALQVLETPGHDAGCLSFRISDCLFTGDSYIPGLPVFYKWKRSDKRLALENEQRLKDLADDCMLDVYSGHYL
ncbi:MAG TPA: MBL fold metallo-hydrolase [Candidatus Parabacteroides intestinavium]|nr:MBL fold metallo-hydrolase [Candidatus Parabacteroides intestinavium]